ncbi:MAG TPA: hypothetical protein VJS64_15050 [Pyrinomonadaceae bacterium]|nr:hypothetical protein [Pyrinomonadaceae bacterium]
MKYPRVAKVAAVIALSAVIAVLFFFYPSLFTRKSIRPASQFTAQDKSDEILQALFPHGDWADIEQLDRFDRTQVIRVISVAKSTANPERIIGISFLLSALGHEYSSNRDVLYSELNKCGDKSYPDDSNCRYLIADYLMELGRRGDASVLPALFDVTDKADGAFAQSLGGFYSDTLTERPQEFLKMLSLLPKKEQGNPCNHAGWEDGSGMGEERVNEVRKSLNALMRDESLAPVARRCLAGVEAAHKASVKNNRDIKRRMEAFQ